MSEEPRTGGCQCGAVRFRINGKLGRASICHCRMCQKQFGSFFGAFVSTPKDGVEWTREEPSFFNSSINVERGFCPRCGTPLVWRSPDVMDIAIGAFDEREDLAPQIQLNRQFKLPWIDGIFDAPVHADATYYARQEAIVSFQHPDHETSNWPVHGYRP